ncbi:hypothetical protein [Sinosporangium siamense]|uniref:Lipoprotein n=1 Tax=Sinosporangium siamense TaxID=1367973 RepID=A0A919V2W3_9ACTN|nr:hypothetical protein [Sinosporangium siamense]GII90345.1 hypothetical protein Ssi02_05760 [Sinosporangium siamense]
MTVRSIRSVVVYAAAVLLAGATLVGCGSDRDLAARPGNAINANPATAAPASPPADGEFHGPCPTAGNARRFAKTRFALHGGLALGAFYRYIYQPLRSGGFKEGAEKRKRTFVKAAIAGAFALHELRVAKGFAMSNPTLCKAVEGVTTKVTALTDKLKGGTATPADLEGVKSSINDMKGSATKNGFPVKEQPVTIPGAS